MKTMSFHTQLWLARANNGGPGKAKPLGGSDLKGSRLRKGDSTKGRQVGETGRAGERPC